ncbi:MAG: methyltransferase [Gammaproteobacteria bacterium]
MCASDKALFDLGVSLRAVGYHFITVSPETHRRVNARPENSQARSLRDVFGWSRPFSESLLPPALLGLLDAAGALVKEGELLRSTVRFSSLGETLYVHSAYPTKDADAVFFGPDSYRFAALIERELGENQPAAGSCIADIGCGTGIGGIVIEKLLRGQQRHLVLADINPHALRYAQINAALAGIENAECVLSDILKAVDGPLDLIVANPPYLVDSGARIYRHGGGQWGHALSVRIVRESLPRLAPGGRLILYTGAAIIEGVDVFKEAIVAELRAAGVGYVYEEIDPDVFGEELDNPAYGAVDRLAAVALIIQV